MHRVNQKYQEGSENITVRRSSGIRNSLRNNRQIEREREKSRVRGYCTRRKQAKPCKGERKGEKETYLLQNPSVSIGTGQNDVTKAMSRMER